MMLRSAAILLFVLASGAAAVPAEATGDNVVLINVTKVALPSHWPGLCNVSGIVSQVWDGSVVSCWQFNFPQCAPVAASRI